MTRSLVILVVMSLVLAATAASAQYLYGRPFVLPSGAYGFAPTYFYPASFPFGGPGDISFRVGFGAADPSSVRPGVTWFGPGQLIPPGVGLAAGARAPRMVPPGLDGSVPNFAAPRPGRYVGSGTVRGMVPRGVRGYLGGQ